MTHNRELPDEHEFFDDLCSLIEEYEGETQLSRVQLLEELVGFGRHWEETYYMTGETW